MLGEQRAAIAVAWKRAPMQLSHLSSALSQTTLSTPKFGPPERQRVDAMSRRSNCALRTARGQRTIRRKRAPHGRSGRDRYRTARLGKIGAYSQILTYLRVEHVTRGEGKRGLVDRAHAAERQQERTGWQAQARVIVWCRIWFKCSPNGPTKPISIPNHRRPNTTR
jgi:hypothetical protein